VRSRTGGRGGRPAPGRRFTIYAFFAKSIGATFFPSDSPTDSLLASLALFGIG
jgi:hypothetical protein